MTLNDIASIKLGTFLRRVQADSDEKEAAKYPVLTMQEVSYESGYNLNIIPEKSYIDVSKKNIDKLVIAKEKDVVFGLLQHRAIIISNKYKGFIVPSNYVAITINDEILYPDYLNYLLNEDKTIKNFFNKYLIKETIVIKAINVSWIRDIKVDNLPSYEIQKRIGNIYSDLIKLKKVENELWSKKELLEINNLERLQSMYEKE